MRRAARLAAVLLLLVWVGPVTFLQTDSWHLLRLAGAPGNASAGSQTIPAGMAMTLEHGTQLKLRMRDGRVVEGSFVRRTLLDPDVYAERFAKALSSAYVPFSMGETLHVSLLDGRAWAAPFAGYAELALLLQNPVGPEPLRVPFEFAREIHRANGEPVEPSALTQAFHASLLPSAEALELEAEVPSGRMAKTTGAPFLVAVEDIESATAQIGVATRNVAGLVVLGVLGLVLLAVVAAQSSPGPSCEDQSPVTFPLEGLTSRAFDRNRGCYVGDPLAVADPWPGLLEGGPATAALAHPGTSLPAK